MHRTQPPAHDAYGRRLQLFHARNDIAPRERAQGHADALDAFALASRKGKRSQLTPITLIFVWAVMVLLLLFVAQVTELRDLVANDPHARESLAEVTK